MKTTLTIKEKGYQVKIERKEQDLTIQEVLDMFKAALSAMEYPQSKIDQLKIK
jgi:hypothetical protein